MKLDIKITNRFAGRCLVVLVVAMFFPTRYLVADEFQKYSFMAGYRQDSLGWSINGAGNMAGSSPNILSELTWRDLNIFQVRGEISVVNAKGIYIRGSAGYGWVLDGENQDSDYAGDNRTLEFSRSVNGVDGSKVMDFKGGFGYEFPFGSQKKYRLVPLLGYSYHAQEMKMTDGNQVVSNLANAQVYDPSITVMPPLGSFSGLNSSYDATWSGAWVGANFLMNLENKGSLTLHLERHWPKYTARANWNLRSDFAHPVSFEHEANGHGWVLELGWNSQPSLHNWEWGVNLDMQQWRTESGIDRTFLVIPGPPCNGNCYVEGVLNGVNWSSRSINISVSKAINP